MSLLCLFHSLFVGGGERREREKQSGLIKEKTGGGADTGTWDTGRAAVLGLLFLCKDKDGGGGRRWFANACASFLRPVCM